MNFAYLIRDIKSTTVKGRVTVDYSIEASFSVVLKYYYIFKGKIICFHYQFIDRRYYVYTVSWDASLLVLAYRFV